jgi:hypothetical protein
VAANLVIENSIVRAFVSPVRRSRYVSLLPTKRGRDILRRRLADFADLDLRFAQRVTDGSADAIEAALRRLGAPAKCYVFSECNSIDTLEIELGAALRMIVGQGSGTILSCIPGRLAYLECEGPNQRYILRRT